MKRFIYVVITALLFSSNFYAQTTGLKSYYKVSEGNGGFPTGLLTNTDYFGFATEGIGDLDGDGIEDVAVGAVFDDDGYTNAGAVWILFLNLDGDVKSYKKIAHNTNGFGVELGNTDVFGASIANIGDLDNDGVIDLAVGAYADDDGATDKGAVYILFMNTDGTVKSYQKISHTTGGFTGSANTYYFGMDVDGVGDLDGDGVEDIVVGAPHDNDGGLRRGAVWVLLLNTDGTVKSEQKISDLSGGFLGTLNNDDRFGYGVSNVGDVNFDGIVDVSLGAFYDDDGGTNKGAVWILFLDTDGTVQDYSKISSTVGNFPSTALANADLFGISTQPLGDIDGDGLNDLLVGADLDDDGGTNRGAFYLINLDSNAEVGSYQKISDTSAFFTGQLGNSDRFGASIARLGDINNDGIVDFVVGSRSDDDGGTDKGAYYMMTLNGTATEEPLVYNDVKISDTQGAFDGILDNSDWFGMAVEGIGDLNGDGVEDFATSSYLDDDGQPNAGAIWILFMNTDGTVNDHQKISNLDGGLGNILASTDVFGNAIENIGDLDGDGVTDLAVGSYLGNDGGTDKGSVYILFLNTDGTVKQVQEISDTQGGFLGTLATYSGFGTSIANIGDLDGDGIIDLAVGAWADTDGGSKRGAVWILFMDDDGTVQSYAKISATSGGFTGPLDYDDRFGWGVESLGDLNNDGVTDIAVGAYYDDDSISNSGAVWILFLDSNGAVSSENKISLLSGNFDGVLESADLFGIATQNIGDIDGDGYLNLLVTARNDDDGGTDRGAIWMLNLKTDGSVNTYEKISFTQGGFSGDLANSDLFGASVAQIGDLNNDGLMEFAVGCILDDDGGTDRGAVYIITLNKTFFKTFVSSYVKLKQKLDGGYYNMYNKELHLQYTEEYEVSIYKKLAYNIYDKNHNLVGGVDLAGTALVAGSPLLSNSIGANKFDLNVVSLSLSINNYYTLEVFNDKNEKKVLKFKVYN